MLDVESRSLPQTRDEAALLSEVLSHVYDASLDPARWPDAIEASCAYLNCGGGVIASVDMLHLDSNIMMSWGYDPSYLARLGDAAKRNSLLRQSLRRKVGEVVSLDDAVNVEEYYASESYNTWAKPQGIVDVMQALLDRTATSVALLGYSRFERHGRADEKSRQRMALLMPHVRRAFLIGKTLDLKRIQAARLADAIDGLASGVFLVDADMHLIHANASGQAMLGMPGFMQLKDGALRAGDVRANRALADIVKAAAGADATLPAHTAPITLTQRSGEQFGVHVLPLGSGARRHAGTAYSAAAAIFVRSTAVNFPGPIKTASQLHDLTQGETRILFVILEVNGVAAAATMLGLSEATVKTHLRNIFRKTGTASQAELVKLVAGYASPLG